MSGLEPIVAAEVAGPVIAAEVAGPAIAEALVAETIAAEALAAEAAKQAALEAFASSAGEAVAADALLPQLALESYAGSAADAMLADSLAPEAALQRFAQSSGEALADAATRPMMPPTFEEMAYEKFLRQGMDADMPGATMRSIQAGLQNNALNTIGSLPQYLGMPAPPPGAGKALQAARLLSPQQDRGTRTSVSPPMLNKGREVNLGAPIAGLLGGGTQMPRRRRLSLI